MNAGGPLERRLRNWRQARADERLFRHLGAIHDLDRRQLELLIALADHHRLVRISEIFVRPSLLGTNPDPEEWSDAELAAVQRRVVDGV